MKQIGALILGMISSYHRMIYSFRKNLNNEYSNNQIQLMMILHNNGDGFNISCLGKAMGLPKGSMTSIVDSLEEKGLVERQFCKTDRRVTEVVLTGKGEKEVKTRLRLLEEFLEERLADDASAKEILITRLGEITLIFDKCTGDTY